jgi:hypothetical protein
MTAAYLPSLEPATQRREKVRRRVRAVSRGGYRIGRERFIGRKGDTLRWLAAFYNRFQTWPTSTELAAWLRGKERYRYRCPDCFALHIRKGVSDLIDTGIVTKHITRECHITGRTVEAWMIQSR